MEADRTGIHGQTVRRLGAGHTSANLSKSQTGFSQLVVAFLLHPTQERWFMRALNAADLWIHVVESVVSSETDTTPGSKNTVPSPHRHFRTRDTGREEQQTRER